LLRTIVLGWGRKQVPQNNLQSRGPFLRMVAP
jgi:hypothetical protein